MSKQIQRFDEEFDWLSNDFSKISVIIPTTILTICKPFGKEFDWFLKDLVRNLTDFYMDSKGYDTEFNWFPKELKRIWFVISLISNWFLKDLVRNSIDL